MSTDSSSDRDPVERLAEEFLDRRRRGEPATIDDYADRYPGWADRIREVFPALEMMEQLKPGSGERTGSFGGVGGDGDGHPARLGDYRILREIGRGGMGVVYEAVQESLGRHVALKVLPIYGRVDPVQMERFRLEARSAARLHHTHIVPVYGVGEHGGVHYYAMQFIQGCGLDAVLGDLRRLRPVAGAAPPGGPTQVEAEASCSLAAAERLLSGRYAGEVTVGPHPEARPDARRSDPSTDRSGLSTRGEPGYHRSVGRIGVQVAQALAHAHGQGVLHRDIKPSNLLLDADGEVWVTDFGLAKVEGGAGLTHTGDVVGTLRYMAPERFEGWSDPRSDVYGLGMTLYELLTLRPAYEAATRARLVERVLHAAPAAPRKLDPRIPRDLETIVLKAIAKEAGARYATANALAEDLGNFLAGKPIRARRVGLPERAWRWSRRNPAAAALVGVSVLAILALTGLAVGLRVHAELVSAHNNVVSARESEASIRYFNNMLMAGREWSNNNAGHAEQLLDECVPKLEETDLRGWEWRYLNRQRHNPLRTVYIGGRQLYDVALSPDGQRFAVVDWEDTSGIGTTVWDIETEKLLYTLGNDPGQHISVAFNREGTLIASSSGTPFKPGEVKVWDAGTGKPRKTFPVGIGSVRGVFSPDGKRLAAVSGVSSVPGVLRVWDIETEKPILEKENEKGEMHLIDVAFSPDGKLIATASGTADAVSTENRPGVVKIWDVETRTVVGVLEGHTGPLSSIAYSPDGKRIATTSWDKTIRIWDPLTKESITLRGHTQNPNRAVFSPDSRRLASVSDDNSAKIWDTETGDELFTLRGHTLEVYGVAFSADGRRLVTASWDKTVKFWDATTGKEALTLQGHTAWVNSATFSPDGHEVASASIDKTVKFFDATSGQVRLTLPPQADGVYDVAYSPDGAIIATAGGDWTRPKTQGEIKLWEAATGSLLWTGKAHAGLARSVAFSPDGTRLATTGGEAYYEVGYVQVWDMKTGQKMFTLQAEGNKWGLVTLAYSPDGRFLAAGGFDGTVWVWDAKTRRPFHSLKGHSQETHAVAFSPSSERLASASLDGTVRVWNVATGQEIFPFRGHKAGVFSVAFSPDGKRIASGGNDYTIKVWEAATGREALTLLGHNNRVRRVAFSPDGYRIVSASQDGILKIWDGTPWDEPPARTSPVLQAKGSR